MNLDNIGPIIVLIIIFLTGGMFGHRLCYLRNRREMEKIRKEQRDDHACLMNVLDNLIQRGESGDEFWRLNKARRQKMLATLRLIHRARELAAKSKLRF